MLVSVCFDQWSGRRPEGSYHRACPYGTAKYGTIGRSLKFDFSGKLKERTVSSPNFSFFHIYRTAVVSDIFCLQLFLDPGQPCSNFRCTWKTNGSRNELSFNHFFILTSVCPWNAMESLRGHSRLVMITTSEEFRMTRVFVDCTEKEDWISYTGSPVCSSTNVVFMKLFLPKMKVLWKKSGSILNLSGVMRNELQFSPSPPSAGLYMTSASSDYWGM